MFCFISVFQSRVMLYVFSSFPLLDVALIHLSSSNSIFNCLWLCRSFFFGGGATEIHSYNTTQNAKNLIDRGFKDVSDVYQHNLLRYGFLVLSSSFWHSISIIPKALKIIEAVFCFISDATSFAFKFSALYVYKVCQIPLQMSFHPWGHLHLSVYTYFLPLWSINLDYSVSIDLKIP